MIGVIEDEIRIDRVPVFTVMSLDHDAAIVPLAVRVIRIERLVCRQSDARAIRAKRRDRIVEVILAVEEGYVGRPEVFGSGNFALRPIRLPGEKIRLLLPVQQIGGSVDSNPAAGAK